MKINTTLIAIASVAAITNAFPDPEAHQRPAISHGKPWLSFCGRPGHFCLKQRSEDNTTDEAVGSVVGACGVPGEPCHQVKRAAFAINDILKRHAAMNPFCSFPSSFCEKQRRSLDEIAEVALDGYDDIVAREAEAEAEASPRKHFFNFCAAPGSTCAWKRDNEAEEEYPQDLISHCDHEGSFCARKRTAPEKRELHKRCALCFGGCTAAAKAQCKKVAHQKWKTAHPYGPIRDPLPQVNHPKTMLPKPNVHPAPPKPITANNDGQTRKSKKKFFNWCGAPGNICNLKRDIEPADAEEAKDKFGAAFYEIRDAMQTIKREAEAEREIKDPMDKIEHCKKSRCSPVTHAHLYAAKNNGKDAEYAEAYGMAEGGLYDEINPYIENIEARVKRAIAHMEA